MPWAIEIGATGAALSEYPVIDFGFVNRLNAIGFGHCILSGLDGNSEPSRGDAIRFIWDKGLASEEVHFEGIIWDNERVDGTPVRKLTVLDIPGYFGWISETAAVRHFQASTPHDIIQGGAGPPNDLLRNSAGTQVLTYGTSAGVPDKVDATHPGVRLADFVADSTRLILNWQRLCLQSRYDDGTGTDTPDGSHGLEFFGQFEGANNSDPRFYLVKRRAQSPSPGETFAVPDDAHQARRGGEGATAKDVMRVIGGGDGQNRVESSIIGSGGLEGVVQDKSIINTTNATNMATRLQELLDPGTEAAMIWSHKHTFSSRVGDTVTLTQDGFSNKPLRIFETGYTLRDRLFIHQLGRPRALDRDPFYQLEAVQGGQGTAPQKTAPIGITGDEPIHANSTALDSETIAASEPGAWATISCAFTGADEVFDYIDGQLVMYYDQSSDSSFRFKVRLLENTGGRTWEAPLSSGNSVAIKGTGLTDVVGITARFIIPVNALLDSGDTYVIQVKLWDTLNGPYTQDIGCSLAAVKQHLHNA